MRKIPYLTLSLCMAVAVLVCTGGMARADSISPDVFNATVAVGGSVTVHKTVTVSAGAPTEGSGDVFFLADNTGSMYSSIANVKSGASTIMNAAGYVTDMRWGAGAYQDTGDTFVYRLNQALTSDKAAAQSGINQWGAFGGGDTPEAQLYALAQASLSGTGWRAGAEKFLIWFGDSPGHDPAYGGVTEAAATAALVSAGVRVYAIGVTPSYDGGINAGNQASRIAAATGGAYYSGISSSSLSTAIIDAIHGGFDDYTAVGIEAGSLPAGIDMTVVPTGYTGSFDRSIERTFGFDVTFTGLTPGDYSFDIFGTVDGGRIATEHDTIKVLSAGVPEPTTLLLLGIGILGAAGLRRFRK